MKPQTLKSKLALLGLVVLAAAGCAKEKKSASSVPTNDFTNSPYVPPFAGPGYGAGDSWQYGATVPFQIVSVPVFSEYTTRSMNNPRNVKLNLNLQRFGSSYGGNVAIGYDDTGWSGTGTEYSEGNFRAGYDANATKYNVWFTLNNQTYWHGFFEDNLGAIIVSIENVVDLGDGQGPEDLADGKVYFKNFEITWAPTPQARPKPTFCWFISLGAYDCQAWKIGNGKDGIDTRAGIDPTGYGYKLLGTFNDISLKKAFNGDLQL